MPDDDFAEAWAEHVREAWALQPHHPTATESLREMNHTCRFCVDGNDWYPGTLGGQMYEMRLSFHAIGVAVHRSKGWRLFRRIVFRAFAPSGEPK